MNARLPVSISAPPLRAWPEVQPCASRPPQATTTPPQNANNVLLHAGHARYLRKARRLGDLLIVGLNSDRSVRRLKGPGRPLMPERDRAELLASLESVDYVTTFGEDTPRELIAELAPDILVKGGDYRPSEVVGRETVEGSGGKIVIIPLAEGRSTTDLIRRVKRLGR